MSAMVEAEHSVAAAAPLDAGARVATLLGLRTDPFRSDELPGFFFVGGQRRYLVQQAVHQLCFGAPTTLLIGDAGVGKSRLLSEVAVELDGVADVCRIDATVMTDDVTLRAAVLTALGLRSEYAVDDHRFIEALRSLRPLEAEPLPVALLIDDADLLAQPVLSTCAALVHASHGRLRLLLAGERSLLVHWRDAPGCAEPGSATVARLELEPLDQRETVDYLRTRLQAAGLRQPLPLSAAGERQLFRLSGGAFAAIHSVAPDLLLATLAPGGAPAARGGSGWRGRLAERGGRLVVAGTLVVLLVVFLLAVLSGSGSDSGSGSKLERRTTAPVPAAGRERVPLVLSWGESDSAAASQPVSADATPAGTQQSLQVPVAAPTRAPATQPVAGPVSPSRPAASEERAIPASTTDAQPAAARQAPQPSGNASAERTYTADEQALLAMDADAFVIQLMGARSLQQLRQSVTAAGVGGRVYYLETRLAGKPWFVALQGPYQQQATAAAIAALPAPVRAAKPWARRLSAVHDDLRNTAR
ncbi:MAG: AAA family ATPase [Spongiibacteraceae bacterium]|nr:AAA family ATPase [Spongiibacteraceae bacterium]